MHENVGYRWQQHQRRSQTFAKGVCKNARTTAAHLQRVCKIQRIAFGGMRRLRDLRTTIKCCMRAQGLGKTRVPALLAKRLEIESSSALLFRPRTRTNAESDCNSIGRETRSANLPNADAASGVARRKSLQGERPSPSKNGLHTSNS